MRFSGSPCQTCKDKHVKCDGAEPICGRCAKAKRVCRAGSSVFRLENEYASGQHKRPRGPRTAAKIKSQAVVSYDPAPLPRPQYQSINLLDCALGLYARKHVYSTASSETDLVASHSDDFMAICKSSVPGPLLHLSISSLALAVFAQTERSHPAAVQALQSYQRLLQMAQATIPFANKANLDDFLLAMHFMSRFEEVLYQRGEDSISQSLVQTLKSVPHHDGQTALLKLWSDFEQNEPSSVIKHTRRGLIRSAFLRKLAIPDWMADGARFGESGLELEYDTITVRIANFRHRAAALLYPTDWPVMLSPEIQAAVRDYEQEALGIDTALEAFSARLPRSWAFTTHEIHAVGVESSTLVYEFTSPATAFVWSLCFALRMLVNCNRARILGFDHGEYAVRETAACSDRVEESAAHVLASVPFFAHHDRFGSFSADRLVAQGYEQGQAASLAPLIAWPLSIASGIAEVSLPRRQKIRATLARIGRVIGVKLLEQAETDDWVRF